MRVFVAGATGALGRRLLLGLVAAGVVGVVELDVADGVVQTIRAVVNPDKLRHIGPVSDMARLPD
jgi:nucleoside-diphosphate-sugar epimerase